jgi:RNA polymerase sigma-70 factor (ECF subfamily)
MGDPEALIALHHDHAAALWGYVVRLTGDPSSAEDVVQETMLRAWRHGLAEGEGGSARAWLYTVARNLVIDESRAAHTRHESAVETLPERGQADGTDALFDTMLITDALLTLSEEHRSVVIRAYYRRLPVNEIAAELDIPPGTVKSRLHYGLRALRLALQERGVTR